ncbi:MAG: hypothetical protein M1438_20305 [Deltaproteobacteria bacterium]|nr:hypothetical protein [Deltaproteobacteria bacterium]
MSIRKVIEIASADSDLVGKIASEFYQIEDASGNWAYACDVDLGADTTNNNVLRNVPVAQNNRDLLYAEIGKPVSLRRCNTGGYEIVGLAKHTIGDTHIIYVNLTDKFGEITGNQTKGTKTRQLNYEELALYGGYGILPYGVYGRFDAQGNLIKVLV